VILAELLNKLLALPCGELVAVPPSMRRVPEVDAVLCDLHHQGHLFYNTNTEKIQVASPMSYARIKATLNQSQ
jgi:hypothetical protein